MTELVKPIPDGYHGTIAYLVVAGAQQALAFYEQAFDAEEITRMLDPSGKIMHAEIRIGEAVVMLSDEMPDWGTQSPATLGGTATSTLIYVENADIIVDRAVTLGATLLRPVQDQFYGDRSGTIRDPFGHHWMFATRIEDLEPEEIERRAAEMFAGKS